MTTENITPVIADASDIKERAELYESMLIEKDEISARIKSFFTDLDNDGYDTRAFKAVVQMKRRGNADELDALQSIVEVYKDALGA